MDANDDESTLPKGDAINLRKRRHFLVVVLTFITGSADAIGFITLGGAFSSVMTGNMVLVGLGAGTADIALVFHAGSAILGFIIGVLVGARISGRHRADDPTWPVSVLWALFVELGVLLIFLLLWNLSLGHRSDESQLALLSVAAVALGIQSSAIQRFGVPGLSSTYLTGTLTTAVAAVASRRPWHTIAPQIQILTTLIVGATLGAVVANMMPWAAPITLIVPLIAVLLLAWRIIHLEKKSQLVQAKIQH